MRVILGPYFLLGFNYKKLYISLEKRLLTYCWNVISWKSEL